MLPLGVAPVYPRGANCNARGLSGLGEHLVRRLMAKRMIVDPDHLSVRARKGMMSLLEAQRYSGVVSSHSWSTPDVVPRIYKLGGVVTPYAGDSKSFVKKWREEAPRANRKKFYFGFGYGADMNGFGAQGHARNGPNPVTYPFKSWDGKQTIQQQRSGQRVYDINKDGVAHYGLYPDWVEDLRKQAGSQIVKDLARGSEAYLQMWERAEGVRNQACRSARGQFTARGMGRQRLGAGPASVLRRAGQPARRQGRVFRWCVAGKGNRKARLAAVFDRKGRVALLASNARGHGTISRARDGKRMRISRGSLREQAARLGQAHRPWPVRASGERRQAVRLQGPQGPRALRGRGVAYRGEETREDAACVPEAAPACRRGRRATRARRRQQRLRGGRRQQRRPPAPPSAEAFDQARVARLEPVLGLTEAAEQLHHRTLVGHVEHAVAGAAVTPAVQRGQRIGGLHGGRF